VKRRGALLIGGLAGLALLVGVAVGGARAESEADCQAPSTSSGQVLTPDDDTAFSVRGYSPTGFEADERYEASWCQTGRGRYALVIRQDGYEFHPSCPARIEWTIPPAGLRIENRPLPMAQFSALDGTKLSYPDEAQTTAMALQDGTDSLLRFFYCDQGRWLVAVYH